MKVPPCHLTLALGLMEALKLPSPVFSRLTRARTFAVLVFVPATSNRIFHLATRYLGILLRLFLACFAHLTFTSPRLSTLANSATAPYDLRSTNSYDPKPQQKSHHPLP